MLAVLPDSSIYVCDKRREWRQLPPDTVREILQHAGVDDGNGPSNIFPLKCGSSYSAKAIESSVQDQPLLQILPQEDYADAPGIRRPKETIAISYSDVPLSDALKGKVDSPDGPAFPKDADIGEKVTVRLRFCGSGYPHTSFFPRQPTQLRAWHKVKKVKKPLTRSQFAKEIARLFIVVTILPYAENHPCAAQRRKCRL
ncbi:hypothetical protein OH77DRAFT_1426564 [Trametes cingulata]|nr:hypothetical protein OH77DRAFT_1426564 [Trametes cingulata]